MAGINTLGLIVRVNAKDAGCLNSLGSINQKRNTTDYDCVNSDTVVTAIGNIKTDPISVGVLYNPADAAGAKELETAFNTGTAVPFEIELADSLGANGTTFSWSAAAISEFSIDPQKDGMALATFTVAVNGAPAVTPAA